MSVVNPDLPSTWLPYKSTNCTSCRAVCCKLPLEVRADDLVRLGLATEDEVSSPKRLGKRLVRLGVVRTFRAATGFFMLEQQANGDCRFLGADRRCTVYEIRPDTCRDFPSKVGPRVGFCPYRKA
ncbi:MAG: YkgJ family cysteine cluster protein [Bdellovibrionota bacterium]